MSLFNRLFRGKKSKENKENEQLTELERELALRRSLRLSSARGTQKGERTCFHEEMKATAPYHSVTAPRLRKGPLSCPGGYRDSFHGENANRSFDGEFRSTRERRTRGRPEALERKCRKQRKNWNTSEYGSGDQSPPGICSQGAHFNEALEESDDQEWDMHDKLMQLDNNCRRFMRKYKHAEERHLYYKSEWRKIYKAKEDSENVFLRQIEQLTRQHDRNVEKIRKLEAELDQYRFGHLSGTNAYRFPVPLSAHALNRSSVIPNLPTLPSSTATPSTSAVESINGAGEALTEQAELSMLRSFHLSSSFIERTVMDDVDETKNFRALTVDESESFLSGIEAPRDAQPEKSTNFTTEEDMILDDGYGTTSDNTAPKDGDGK